MFSSRAFKGRKAVICGSLAGAAVLTAGMVAAVPAKATSIDQYTGGGSRCGAVNSRWAFCLWYSQYMDGGVYGATGDVKTISGTFIDGGDGSAGVGQAVRNNAASAAMDVNSGTSYSCSAGAGGVFIWVYPNFTGNVDSLHDWYGGNLTSDLRNNEASVEC